MVGFGKKLAWLSVIVAIASGCAVAGSFNDSNRGESDNGSPLLYLQEVRPACTAPPGSDQDPCAVRGAPDLPSIADIEYLEVPNYWDLYFDPDYPPSLWTTHLVVRGTFLPETTRCAQYERELPDFIPFDVLDQEMLMCFADVQVNEYLVGVGPPTLTSEAYSILVEGGAMLDFERFRTRTAEAFEGREGVMFMGPSSTTVLEAWTMLEFWDVQRTGDQVMVVAPYKEYFEAFWRTRFTAEDRALMEVPLSEFEVTIRKGAAARAKETSGRIAIGEDLPLLITDANMLRPYFEGPGVGVSYETDAPEKPPPAPGRR